MKFYFGNRILSAVIMLTLLGCVPAYVPNVVNTPLLSNRRDFQAGLYAGVSGFDPQITYAATDHLGLMLNGSFANRNSGNTADYHKHTFLEIGAGYYRKVSKRGRFETFGGLGIGNLQAAYQNNIWQESASVSCLRLFVQPDIGFTSGIFDFGLASRVAIVDMYQGSAGSVGIFLEPAVTTRLGFRHIKAFAQLGLSGPLNGGNIDFDFEPLIFAIGLHARFGNK